MSDRVDYALSWVFSGVFCFLVALFAFWGFGSYVRRYGHVLTDTPRTLMQRVRRFQVREAKAALLWGPILWAAVGVACFIVAAVILLR